jgi:hypothetical protein
MAAYSAAGSSSSSCRDVVQQTEDTPLLAGSRENSSIKTARDPDRLDDDNDLAPYIHGKATFTQTVCPNLGSGIANTDTEG